MSSDNIRELARKNFLFPALLKTISFSSSAVVIWLFGRKLAVEEYGIYNIFQAFLLYISIFSSLGLPLTLYRFLPEFQEKKAFRLMKNTLTKAIVFRGIYAIVLIQLIILFYDKISPIFHITGYKNIFIVWGIGMLFSIELEHYLLTYSSLFFHRIYTSIYGLYSVLRLVLVSYTLFTNPNLKGVIWAEVISLLFQFLLLTAILVKKFPKSGEETDTTEYTTKRLAKYALYSYFQDIADVFFYINTDFFVISYFLGNVWTGIYAMGANLAFMLSRWYPIELFVDIIRPIFFKRYARYKSDDVLSEMFSFLCKVNLIVGLPVFLFLLILGKKFLIIFFPKYTSSYIVLFVAGFFVMIRGPRTVLEMCVYAREKLKITLQSKIFSLYNLFADIVFVTKFGIVGASFASGSSELFRFLYIYRTLKRETNIRFIPQKMGAIIANSAILAVYFILTQKIASTIISFAIVSLGAVVLYALLTLFITPFTSEEKNLIKSVILSRIVK